MAISKKVKTNSRPKAKEEKNGKKQKAAGMAERVITGVVLFLFALLLVFAFFQNAGSGGELAFKLGRLLLGSAVFILPLCFALGGCLVFGMESYRGKIVAALLVALIISVSGLLGVLDEG
ncbi:MAG: hypothetical protein Q8P12_00970, partial [bacterium]|nr:hypothetical protein [bacterium]